MTIQSRQFTIEELYKAILEIGSECVYCGICYSDFKQQLINRGFVFIDTETNELTPQIEEYVQFWFAQNFLHADATCKHPTEKLDQFNELSRQKHVHECIHFISQDSCMNLLALRQAEYNKNAASKNLLVAKIAAGISLVALLYTGCENFIGNRSTSKSVSSMQSSLDTLKSLQRTTINQYDVVSSKVDTLSNVYRKLYVHDTTPSGGIKKK